MNYQQMTETVLQKTAHYRQQLLQHPIWKMLQQRWQLLSKRERYLLMGMSGFLVFLIFYFFVWSPLVTSTDNYQQKIIKDQELLVFMQAAAPRISAAKGQFQPTQTITQDMLLTTIESSLTAANLKDKVTELGLGNDNSIHLQFTAVDFDKLMLWLIELRQQYGIIVDKFNAVPAELPGVADADLHLILNKK